MVNFSNSKRMFSLIWIMIDSTYGISYKSYLYFKKKQRLWEFFLTITVVITMIVSIGPLYYTVMKGMFGQYKTLGLQSIFLANSIALSGLLGLFLGVFLTINSLFFSKNVAVLIPLPLKPREVMMGKIFEILTFQMLVSVVFLLPPTIYYGAKMNVDIWYWISSIIVFMMSQIIPVSLIIMFILPMSRILKFQKNRDFMILLAGILLLVLSLLFVGYTNKMAFEGVPQEKLFEMLSDPESVLNRFTTIYFPAFLASKSLLSPGFSRIFWMIIYVALNLSIFGLTTFIGEKFYYNTYMELQESHAKKTKLKSTELEKALRVSNLKSTLLLREWRYFLKVPSFAFNGLASVVIFPVMLIMLVGFKNSPEFAQILSFLNSYRNLIVPFGILFATLSASMSTLASSAFSREGKLIKELKILPIPVEEIVKAKLLQISMVSILGIVFSIIALDVLVNIRFIEMILIFLVSVTCTTFLNIVQMLIDASKPVLDWDNPQKAMKQNLNVAMSIPIIFGFTGGFGYLIYLLMDSINPKIWEMIFLLIGTIPSLILWKSLINVTRRLFRRDL